LKEKIVINIFNMQYKI